MVNRTVILVTGPPAAGKSTFVRQHAKPGDLILDADELGQRTMRQRLAQVAAMREGTAWVIRCCPGATERDALAQNIGATRRVHLQPDTGTLMARARTRPQPWRHVQAIRKWLAVEQGKQTTRHDVDPAPRPSTRW